MMFDSYKNSPAYDITGTCLASAMQSDNSAIHNNINNNNYNYTNNKTTTTTNLPVRRQLEEPVGLFIVPQWAPLRGMVDGHLDHLERHSLLNEHGVGARGIRAGL